MATAFLRATPGPADLLGSLGIGEYLDSKSSEQVFHNLQTLVREGGKTIIAVTHDLDMASRMDRRIHLVDGSISADDNWRSRDE